MIRGPEVECLLALELVGRPEKGANLHFLMALSAAEKRVGSFLFTAGETKDAEKIAEPLSPTAGAATGPGRLV